jgi:hypothetical protein
VLLMPYLQGCYNYSNFKVAQHHTAQPHLTSQPYNSTRKIEEDRVVGRLPKMDDRTSSPLERAGTLCKRCCQIDLSELLNTNRTLSYHPSTDSEKKEPLFINLGPRRLYLHSSIASVLQPFKCALCSLISRLLLDCLSHDLSENDDVFLVPTNALHRIEPDVSFTELDPERYVNYLYLAHRRPSNGSRLDYPFEVPNAFGDAQSSQGLAALDIGSNELSIGTISRWIRFCEQQHAATCSVGWDKELYKARLIDVETMRIIPYPSSEKIQYMCLSYVWGRASQRIIIEDSTLKDAPQTITDSIEFVKRIGKKYLWVDSVRRTHRDHDTPHFIFKKC